MTGSKKNLNLSVEEKGMLIEPAHPELSIVSQCELLGLPRSSYYYEPVGVSDENELYMRLIDEIYTKTPFFGSRKITAMLKYQGYPINRKRVQRLMREMGLEAIYPKPRLSCPAEREAKYPYLLKGLVIDRPNQVWATDITYIRLRGGHIYLVAVMDWFSRYVLSWALSNTLEQRFCLEALDMALSKARPEIFNSDQGSQFTSADFTGILKANEIRISWDGKGRCFDNIFVERLWRTVKYEEVYLHDRSSIREAKYGFDNYFDFYNRKRPHQSLDYRTPEAIYCGGPWT